MSRPVTHVLVVGLAVLGLSCRTLPVIQPDATQPLSPAQDTLIRERIAAVESSPRDAEERGSLGFAYLANGLETEAAASFAQASELDPDNPYWSYYQGVALHEGGELPEALIVLQSTTEAAPSNPAFHLQAGYCALDAGEPQVARRAFERASDLLPDRHEPLIGMAAAMLEDDEFVQAELVLMRAMQRNDQSGLLHQYLGQALAGQGRSEQALPHLERGQEAKREFFATKYTAQLQSYKLSVPERTRRAHDLLQTDPAESRRILEGLRAERPDDLQVQLNLSLALEALGERDRAKALLEDIRSRDGSFHLAHVVLADMLLKERKPTEALAAARQAVALSPQHAQSRHVLGLVLRNLGRREEARQHLRKAIEYQPSRHGSRLVLAELCAELGDFPGAIAQLREAVNLQPRELSGRLRLVEVLARSGRRSEARSELGKARQLAPSDPRPNELARNLGLAG